MAGINFLGIKSGSSQSKAHRYLAAKKQNAQIPCYEKAKRTSILLQKSKAHRYLAIKKQSAQIPCHEFARKFKALKSLELPQRFVFSNPLCVFCFVWILRQRLSMTKSLNFVILSVSEKSKEFEIRFEFMDTSLSLSITKLLNILNFR